MAYLSISHNILLFIEREPEVLSGCLPQTSQHIFGGVVGARAKGPAIVSGYKAGQLARLAGQPFVKSVIDLHLVPSLWDLANAKLTPSSFSKHHLQWPFSSIEDILWFYLQGPALSHLQAALSWLEFLVLQLETALQHTSPY